MMEYNQEQCVIELQVNGQAHQVMARPADILLDVLRQELGLTGAKPGCKNGDCGACTVIMDGWPVKSCLVLAVEAVGHQIMTVEGLGASSGKTDSKSSSAGNSGDNSSSDSAGSGTSNGNSTSNGNGNGASATSSGANSGYIDPVQAAFVQANAFQCGYCTSGFLMVCHALANQKPDAEEYEIESWLESNLCRCTSYQEVRQAVNIMLGRS